jgi:hypothetical protein
VSTTAAATVRRFVRFVVIRCVVKADHDLVSSPALSGVFVTSQRHKNGGRSPRFIMLCFFTTHIKIHDHMAP